MSKTNNIGELFSSWLIASILLGGLAFVLILSQVWEWAEPSLPGSGVNQARHLAMLLVHSVSPTHFTEQTRAYKNFWQSLPEAIQWAITWRVALSLAASGVPSILLWHVLLKADIQLMHIRGSRRYSGVKAPKVLKAVLKSQSRARPDHEIYPGVPYPASAWTKHVLIVGGVGSGKSTAMKPIIEKVIAAKEQVLLFDPKGEFTEHFDSPAILAPWDERSIVWDIAKDMRNVQDMRRFAANLIPASQDPMWSNASREIVVGLLTHLKLKHGDAWEWKELAGQLRLTQAELLEVLSKVHPPAARVLQGAQTTVSGILINLNSSCAQIFDLASAWGDQPESKRVSFVEWTLGTVKPEFLQIIMQGHGSYPELTKAYVPGVVGTISAIVNSVELPDDPNRKIWFIADELPQMGKIPLRALFEVGRSRGVRGVVACQDFAQLIELYGKDAVRSLTSMCGTTIIGQITPGETAEALCKVLGSREIERRSTSTTTGDKGSTSTSTSHVRETVPLYLPSELSSCLGLSRDGKSVALILFTEGKAFELSWPMHRKQVRRDRMQPAAWVLGPPAHEPPLSDDDDTQLLQLLEEDDDVPKEEDKPQDKPGDGDSTAGPDR